MSSIARGALALNEHAFFVINDKIYEILVDGTIVASWGPIEDDHKPVTMAANYYQLVIVSGLKAYYVTAGSLAEVPWLIGTEVLGVDFINGYFVFLANSSFDQANGFFWSEPGDVTLGDVLNFKSAEASANKLTRLIVQNQRIWCYGEQVIQVFFDNSSVDPLNPFQQDFSGVVQQGTAAPASVTSLDNSLFWISRSTSGQGIAWRMDGFTPTRVSTFAVAEAWRKYPTIEDAVGWTVIIKDHTWWRVWFPTANETWQYDASLPPQLGWSKQLFFNGATGLYEADRGSCACAVGSRVFVGDRANGKIYEMTLDALNDDGERIRWLRRAPILTNENKLTSFPWFELDMLVGQGDGSNLNPDNGEVTPEAEPKVMFRWSDDWGNRWSNEYMLSTGTQGQFSKRVVKRGTGSGRQRVFEVSGSASVPVCINNVYLRDPMGRRT